MSTLNWYKIRMTSSADPIPLRSSASNQQSNSYASWKAFNGSNISPTDGWATAQQNKGWIQLDVGKNIKVNRLKITSIYNNGAEKVSPKNFSLLGSNDGITFNNIMSIKDEINWTNAESRVYAFNSVDYRFYRVDVQDNNGGNVLIIGEIEFGLLEYEKKHLLQSNNKIYSLETINSDWYNTNMTSNTTPSPLVASASGIQGSYDAWKAFNGTVTNYTDGWATPTGVTRGWVQIKFGEPKVFTKVKITSKPTANIGGVSSAPPKDFNILGSNNGVDFEILAEIKNQTNWGVPETREFTFKNYKQYTIYRVEVLNNNGTSYTALGNVLFYENYSKLLDIPNKNSANNFTKYGKNNFNNLDSIIAIKNYILQDEVSKNKEGLWTTKLDRKPLSISFN